MSDFSDEYFKVRSAIEPKPKMTDRDVSNRALQLGDQYQPRTEIIDPTGTFTACDEWVQCISLQPQQATGLVRLLAEGGGFTVGDEPFYVSGSRIFTVDTGGQVLVQRAVRRELLSRMLARDFAENGAAFSESYDFDGAVGFLTVATDWLYLGADFVWRQALIGTCPAGFAFGPEASDKDVAGRYYNVAWGFTVDVGSPSFWFVREQGTTVGPSELQLSAASGAPARGAARIGDFISTASGAAASSQASVLGGDQWTLALKNNVNATFTGKFSVRRRGF